MVLINGEATRFVDVADRGFQYGDGIFTTLPVRGGHPVFLEDHLRRLARDASQLFLPPPDLSSLRRETLSLAEEQGDGVLKIILTRGLGGRGYLAPEPATMTRVVSMHPAPDHPAELREVGVTVGICTVRLGHSIQLAGAKHLNRLEQVLARREWRDGEVREALMCDQDGFVVEGVMSNLFMVRGGTLETPLLDRCGVRGVMRERILMAARELAIPVAEGRYTVSDVGAAEELFLSNSVIGIWPVARLQQRRFAVGPVSRRIAEHIERMVCGDRGGSCRG